MRFETMPSRPKPQACRKDRGAVADERLAELGPIRTLGNALANSPSHWRSPRSSTSALPAPLSRRTPLATVTNWRGNYGTAAHKDHRPLDSRRRAMQPTFRAAVTRSQAWRKIAAPSPAIASLSWMPSRSALLLRDSSFVSYRSSGLALSLPNSSRLLQYTWRPRTVQVGNIAAACGFVARAKVRPVRATGSALGEAAGAIG